MTFQFNSRYVLLTYAQCGDLDPFKIVDLLGQHSAECIIGRENHEDGGVHLHAFVDFGRKFRSRRTDIFDVDGRHPNVSPSKGTPEKGYDYAIKDGDVVAGGLERPTEQSPVRNSETHAIWTSITTAENRQQFWELLHRLDPKSAACSYTQLSKYADWRFAPEPERYEHPHTIEFIGGGMDGRDDWIRQTCIGREKTQLGRRILHLHQSPCGGVPPLPSVALRGDPTPPQSGFGAPIT